MEMKEPWAIEIDVFDRNLSRRMRRISEHETSGGRSECIHGMLEGMCSICIGIPQSDVLEGPPFWARRRL